VQPVNENALIAGIANLFALEHNYWAEVLSMAHPGWNNDQVFYKARSYTIQIYQAIVWQEWVPAVIGTANYFANITEVRRGTPEPTQEFGLIATQFFRTLLNEVITPYTGNATQTLLNDTLSYTVYNAWVQRAHAFDVRIDQTQTNNAQTNMDYMSEYMVWERQLGLGSFESVRQAYGMSPAPIPAIPADYLAASPALPAFFAEPLDNRTSAIAPAMAWIIMEQLHRSAR
jgi:hypothetical protein